MNDHGHTATLPRQSVDVVIIGGGVAGLWLLNRLCGQGYDAILLEQGDLGGSQTLASQGMIHGGIKYALGGALTGASEAIADMPGHWRRCLRGEGDVDLRGCRVLSEHFYMWSTQSITSRVSSFFASKVTRGRVETVSRQQRPPVFQTDAFRGKLYKLVDLVLDVPSLVETLAENCPGRIFRIDWQRSEFVRDTKGTLQSLRINGEVEVNAQQFVFTAGEGNQALCDQLGIHHPSMQSRPLRQVLVKHDYDYQLYAHCMGANPSPRLTVSSHRCADGKTVWYLGGDLATESVDLSDAATIDKAKQELASLFPWLDFSHSEWATLYINRAEPRQKALVKPDKAFAERAAECPDVIVAWPTKLTLAPNMADEVCKLLEPPGAADSQDPERFAALPPASVGIPCWDTLFPSAPQ